MSIAVIGAGFATKAGKYRPELDCDTEVINQNMRAIRQRLLMQPIWQLASTLTIASE